MRVMLIGAHPDDCEYHCGGAAAIWAANGCELCFVSTTNGQSGHQQMKPTQLIPRRAREAAAAAGLVGAASLVLPIPDGYLEPSLDNRLMLIRQVRQFAPQVIITHRPNDYHPDHRYTSQLVQDAAFMLTVPQVAPEAPAMTRMPVIFYWWDHFQKPAPFKPDVVADIDGVYETKLEMLHQHASQLYEWLPWHEGLLDQVPDDDDARRIWLRQYLSIRKGPTVADRCRAALAEAYGPERGQAVEQAEVFELCEYGSAPDEGLRETLFAGMGLTGNWQ